MKRNKEGTLIWYHLTIDGVSVQVPENTSVLEAARQANIKIPTLCYLKGVNAIGACRVCLVEIVGQCGAAGGLRSCR